MDHIRVGLQEDDFDLGAEIKLIKKISRKTGGIVVFLGVSRDSSGGKEVLHLEFEAYREMAEKELMSMAREAVERFSLLGLTILHRLGRLPPEENIVLIIASAEHREEAFSGSRWCIDELKKRIPIWKKESFADGEVWVQESP